MNISVSFENMRPGHTEENVDLRRSRATLGLENNRRVRGQEIAS